MQLNAVVARLAFLLALGPLVMPTDRAAASDRRDAILRPSSEDARPSLPLRARPSATASGPKRPSAAQSTPARSGAPAYAPIPAPAHKPIVPAGSKPKPRQEPPKPPEPIMPPEKPRSADPIERMREDLQDAREKLESGRALDAFRDAAKTLAQINAKKLAENGLDGKGARAEECRQVRAEALRLTRDASKFLSSKPTNASKPLRFYF